MAGLIPRTFIEDLVSRLDIVEVIDARVPLKKTGANFMACCPFHNEKSPSFSVNPNKQFYYCFGCGASGDAIKFLMEYERLEFTEAVEQLANKAGIEVPREERTPQQKKQEKTRKTLYDALTEAARFFFTQLRHEAAPRNYLVRRELSPQIARDFGLGYAPGSWDALLKHLSSKGYRDEQLIEAGLLIENEESNRRYDRFRNRVMFPIRDGRGRVIAFGGRVLDDSKPKYLNSPETPVFHKGRELYGLFECKQKLKQIDRLMLVEGYMDVVALGQFDIHFAVATLGTAATEDHIQLAFKHAPELVFCFDGDAAGRRAAARALQNTLPYVEDGRSVRFLFLPDGEDPDSLVRRTGTEQFLKVVAHAMPLEEYIFEQSSEGIDLSSMDGRAKLAKRVAPQIAKLPPGIFHELMNDELAKRTGLNRTTIDRILLTPEVAMEPVVQSADPQDYEPSSERIRPKLASIQTHSRTNDMIRRVIGLLSRQPAAVANIEVECSWPDTPSTLSLIDLIEVVRKRPEMSASQLYGVWLAKHGAVQAQELMDCIALTQTTSDSTISTELGEYQAYFAKKARAQTKSQRLNILKRIPLNEMTDEQRNEYRQLIRTHRE
ncbi:DNA primase [Umboniibacter marinipuniceus]|uniref:DNA primase n=1 Tax=Umboniibacter marinipuniceus TaxID=569599 RepID=A0A3M0A9H0_9GAMM|nr:DNA primase [Umboniibacter marinipuniceus]RMA80139.1 DNA primase [Umboniibacter marinipuniceus]